MKKCALCLSRNADKKGSHYVPHFLISSVFSSNGSKERDKEISFRLGSKHVDMFVGRSVLPEEVEDVLGRELTDDELESNTHHHTRDFFICTPCENRFSVLESYYSIAEKKQVRKDDYAINPINGGISMLFWISVIWRWSVIGDGGYQMSVKDEKKLRHILNLCLGNNEEELLLNIEKYKHLMSDMQYLLLFNDGERPASESLVIAHPRHRLPYSFSINRYVVFFYIKKKHFLGVQQTFFGYEQEIDAKHLNGFNSEVEEIIVVPEERTEKYIKSAIGHKANDIIREQEIFVDRAINMLFSRHLKLPQPHPQFKALIIQDFWREMGSDKFLASEDDLRYTEKRAIKILYDVLKKHI